MSLSRTSFGPNRKWKRQFWREIRKAARALNIETSGVHRLRANFAQDLHASLLRAGASDQSARQTVSEALGHNRTSVTGNYVPFG